MNSSEFINTSRSSGDDRNPHCDRQQETAPLFKPLASSKLKDGEKWSTSNDGSIQVKYTRITPEIKISLSPSAWGVHSNACYGCGHLVSHDATECPLCKKELCAECPDCHTMWIGGIVLCPGCGRDCHSFQRSLHYFRIAQRLYLNVKNGSEVQAEKLEKASEALCYVVRSLRIDPCSKLSNNLYQEISHIIVQTAWDMAVSALHCNRRHEAGVLLSRLLQLDGSHDAARQLVNRIKSERDQSLKKVTELIKQRDLKNAERLCCQLQKQYNDDPEVIRMTSEIQNQLGKLLFEKNELNRLRSENRLFELQQRLKVLREQGVNLSGLRKLEESVDRNIQAIRRLLCDVNTLLLLRQYYKAHHLASRLLVLASDCKTALELQRRAKRGILRQRFFSAIRNIRKSVSIFLLMLIVYWALWFTRELWWPATKHALESLEFPYEVIESYINQLN